ncbi:MAG: transposase [Muribaculaceae bacterium]|nr:transposase [Muribaculaceae bacterium]
MFLDKKSPIEKTYTGDLPHWFQAEKIQFVTFRLADSLPPSKLEEVTEIRQRFLKSHPLPWNQDTIKQYNMIMGHHNEEILDNGYGECHLKDKGIRDIVSESLRYGANVNYKLIAYIIMPNHIHLLLQPYGEEKVEKIIGSIKRFTSRVINTKLGRSGKFWQREIWARIVRNSRSLTRYIEYIRQNPRNLKAGEYSLYVNEDFR